MAILMVDDSVDSRRLMRRLLEQEGHRDFLEAGSAPEAMRILGEGLREAPAPVELILMDLQLPGMNGIEACRRIGEDSRLRDIPVIVVTASSENGHLPAAFQAGAVDYLLKPVNPIELTARVRSVLRLKREMDQRKQREAELIEMAHKLADANLELERLSSIDGLTGLTNRRRFDELYLHEWKRAIRVGSALTAILIDIDHFKGYNDRYGHLAGDDCLRRVAVALREAAHRPGDSVARYGGEEFVAVLAETDAAGARTLAESMRRAVEKLAIEHAGSSAGSHVTASLGVATTIPDEGTDQASLLAAADEALYESKRGGRNRASYRDLSGGRLSRAGVRKQP
jgi:diguanylate cyclase (GGDEF)-like protein